jgi:transposase-like protein
MADRITLAEVARRYSVPYSVLWRWVRGGGYLRQPALPPELEERLRAALAELEGKEVAGHAS